MTPEQLTPRQREFGERFAALMSEFYDVVGPVDGDDIDEDVLSAQQIAELPPIEGAFLAEWIILTAWSDMTGQVYTTKYVLPSMPHHHQLGLIGRWYGMLLS